MRKSKRILSGWCRLFFGIALVLCWGLIGELWAQTSSVHIAEGEYEGVDHFIISTPAATYYYDKAGGGLSRMIDPAGLDWIAFHREPWNNYPEAAASSFRGIPNFVFRGPDGGAGHPGHEKCTTEQLNEHTLISTSLSTKWKWKWEFFDDYSQVTMLQTDPEVPYWFLYEGMPGGVFEPQYQYYGIDRKGVQYDQPDYFAGDKRFFQTQWAYFGHRNVDRVLYVAQSQKDTLADTFSYLGNSSDGIRSRDGMIVFGFGREEGANPLLQEKMTFILGFHEAAIHNRSTRKKLKRQIRQQLRPLTK